MKYLVIGLEGLTLNTMFGDERLENFRRLMEFGCFGRLEDASALHVQEAWKCLAEGQAGSLPGLAIWDYLAVAGVKFALIGVPVADIAEETAGIFVVCRIQKGGKENIFSHPPEVFRELSARLSGSGETTSDGDQPLNNADSIATSQQRFGILQDFLTAGERGYLQFVDRRRIKAVDDKHIDAYASESSEYLLHLDRQVGQTLEALSEDTVVLIVSIADNQPAGFILATPGLPLQGEIQGAHLQDLAPTLLELGGMPIPAVMHGKPLVTGGIILPDAGPGLTPEEEEILRERLSGLGYIE